ncbi:MAG: phosphoenolpyruvate--protein phosphotransferase [Actinomycetota bacterium]|nr:phosphoenolpyruvate--protein phosphotransferase [Actinomycetota bacterium]
MELAREMGGEGVPIEAAGGLDEPGNPIGTDAALVVAAIEKVDSGEGVLVLMDLGSAVMSAEVALDMLSEEQRERVYLSEAPLVEGAVAAAAAARVGEDLESVAREARGGLQGKAAHLGADELQTTGETAPEEPDNGGFKELQLTVTNPLGLHARPAARFVRTASDFDAKVEVTNLTSGRGPVTAKSLNAIATLGVRRDHAINIRARGPQATEVLAALQVLADEGFGDQAGREEPTRAVNVSPVGGATFTGLPVSPGSVLGVVRRLRRPALEIPADMPVDADDELAALQEAVAHVRRELSETRANIARRAGEQNAAIFDVHLLLLDDPTLLDPVRQAISEDGWSAARAWAKEIDSVVGRYRSLDDEYQRERAEDVAEVGHRVLARLIGMPAAGPELGGPGILVAAELAPAETAALDPELVLGIVTARGGPTGHAAILARSLGVPTVVGAGDEVLELEEGSRLLIDGASGAIYIDPDAEIVSRYELLEQERQKQQVAAQSAASEPAVTSDGRRIEVAANLGSVTEVEAALAAGADGVGLLRTEFLFLDREAPPTEEDQFRAYAAITQALDGRPLIIRTMDVGADKPPAWLELAVEENPFMGLRGIRLSLAQPEILLTQLRAVLRAAAGHALKLMFPMVSTINELQRARDLLEQARTEVAAAGHPTPQGIEVGIMVEVPACAVIADAFAPHVDFFSIGTNDLTQYTLAADRGNERVAGLADHLHPSILRLIALVVEAAGRHDKWVGVCGELAGDPGAAQILVGLGVTELSMSPPSIALVKDAIRRVTYKRAQEVAASALEMTSASEVRQLIESD